MGDRLVIAGRRLRAAADGGDEIGRFFEVITIRDGRVVRIQGCRSREAALRQARRAA